MRVTPDVDIPEELIDAARRRRLVLFVGAGVSLNPPSNLPLFGSLAKRVAEQLGVDHEGPELPSVDDFPDQFLGHLANEQPSVKEQVRAIIDASGSKPTPTHHVVARLAAASGAPIVSTNYDEHIETAAAAGGFVLGDRFNAPALPLGRDFNGIVYLHGAVTRPAAELVVTDEDFGRAYLTDGWARRFVQELFLNWTVLFVGYSHSDFVMRYLARGLPPNTIRFALTDKPDSKHWGALGIRPVPYDNHDDHAELSAALESWAKLLEMGHLDEHARAREIAIGAPPKAPDEADFLAFAVTNPTGARGFALAADGYEWLRWVEEQEVFRALFVAGRCENEASIVLAEWFVETYVKDPEMSALALGTIERLGPVVCDQLLSKIALAAEDLAPTSAQESTRWSALVTAGLRTDDGDPERLWHNPYRESLTTNNRLSLLRRALRARIVLSERRPWFGDEESDEPLGVSAEIVWSCSKLDLSALWEPLRERLPANAIDILQIAEQGLLDAYQLLRAVEPDREWDSWSHRRSAIEPHEQDRLDSDETPIIDALRDAGTIVAATDRSLAKRWVAQEFALFRRLGLHLLIEDNTITVREKLDLLLAGDFLYDHEAKHEVFRLLETLSPRMDASERQDLLPRLLDGPPPFGLSDAKELRLHDRGIFDRVEWIQRNVQDWPELDAALEGILQRHPDMGVRPHPDMDHWMESGTWGGVPPFEVDEFIDLVDSEGAHAAIADLLARDYSEENFGEPTWDDATNLIREVVTRAPRLGAPLMTEVVPSPLSKHADLIAAVIYGWAGATLSEEEVSSALEQLVGFAERPELARAISELCRSVVDQRAEVRPEHLLSRVDELARQIWDTHADEYEPGEWRDPVTHGLNTWPGFIAQYWLFRISLRWRTEAESWAGLSQAERDALREILESRTGASIPALGILATDLYFLFAADRQFTIDAVFRVFDLERSTHPAVAWKSYLHSPRRTADMLDSGFWPLLQDAQHLIETVEDSALRQQYWDVLASVAAFSEADSVHGMDLVHSLASPQESTRLVPFLRALGRGMSLADDEAREQAWSAWIRDAMQTRTHAVPGVQPIRERSAWADLALEMGTLVPEALHIVDEAPAPFTDRTRFDQLPESLLQSNSDLIAETTYHRLLAMDEADWHAHFQLEKLVARLKRYASMQSLRAVTERSITLGIAGAINWLN